jgi:hypothetical protein
MELQSKNKRNGARVWLGLLLWIGFAAGLLLQALGSHLKIYDNKFVIPPSLLSGQREVRPDEIVACERRMQALSGILTLGSGLGLGFYYRQTLFQKATSKGD